MVMMQMFKNLSTNLLTRMLSAAISYLLVCNTALAQNVTVKLDDMLRADPNDKSTGPKVSSSARGTMIERRGFWVKVRANNAEGWLKLSAVALDQAEGGTSGVSALVGIASGRVGTGNIVTASGTRGLSDEELKSAKPDAIALDRVKKSVVSEQEVQQFAATGGLRSRQIALIPPPEPTNQNESKP